MFTVDTNVLVHAVREESPYHEKCRQRLEAWREGLTPGS
jgi:predicted nucleic acid-binding protein